MSNKAKKVQGTRKDLHVCESCGKEYDALKDEIAFEPDPFAEEIHGDSTPIWQCSNCAYESSMDI